MEKEDFEQEFDSTELTEEEKALLEKDENADKDDKTPDGSTDKQKDSEEEVDWEKRYKDLQSYSDQRHTETQAELKKLQGLVAPFQKDIVDKEGSLSFDFSKTKTTEKEISKPTADEWLENPGAAADKHAAYQEQQREKKDSVKQAKAEEDQAETQYKKTRSDTWKKLSKDYPDIANSESPLAKKAQEILDDDPNLIASPYCDRTATRMAAAELGISAVKSSQENTNGKQPDTSYMISGSSGKGKKSTGKLSDEEFFKLDLADQNKYMKDQVLK